ncbi:plexin domain-containing protein 2 isoform X3 [Drosophila hydei]|uniref:Plexin domain-containing protein 2 isoform X3 n=1 Tax=Drosophila hydei TaxID=7224 RepID=A0A6J1M1J6_DROHY|nr:plexin domain-containing protein 2 isoform X3 [Drosophila hydei]
MAKTVGRAYAQIAILLTIFGSIQYVKSISPESYVALDTKLAFIYPEKIVRLSTDQSARQRRFVPIEDAQSVELQRRRRNAPAATADSTPILGSTMDVKNQYQSVSANVNASGSTSTTDGATVTTVDSKTSATGSVTYNVHNVGVNGTGQRKDLSSQQNGSSDAANSTNGTTSINVAAVQSAPPKKTQLMASQPMQYPKKVAAQSVPATTTTTERPLIDEVDVSDEVITKEANKSQLTRHEDHYDYYRSLFYINETETSEIWTQYRGIPENSMLSSSYRRAMTVELKFGFPFYGHNVRNITVATGGFLYTGEYVHSWLAATQYIAPLMANFDTSMSDDSFVRLLDNGTAFTVVWENVTLQDKPNYGKFTFSATLHQTGDIVFVYYQLPTSINTIQDNQHPVKVGLSDAYIVDKMLLFARRKTIYEYHRVTFGQQEITNGTIVVLTALPTCLGYSDCQSCINHNTTFECVWCPTLNRCSTNTGNDRRKQKWQQSGCDRSMISSSEACPVLGHKGNNAAQENKENNSSDNNSSNNSNNSSIPSGSSDSNGAAGSSAVTEPTMSSTQHSASGTSAGAKANRDGVNAEKSEHLGAVLPENKNVGVAVGFMVPICLVFAVTLWLFYAYRNPHTRSGQLLIQFRPSQWSWRRGEARYTAATIHM